MKRTIILKENEEKGEFLTKVDLIEMIENSLEDFGTCKIFDELEEEYFLITQMAGKIFSFDERGAVGLYQDVEDCVFYEEFNCYEKSIIGTEIEMTLREI